jgi:hypothetical protein
MRSIVTTRPFLYQKRPCNSDYLPLEKGDVFFFQKTGFASFPVKTKRPENRAVST